MKILICGSKTSEFLPSSFTELLTEYCEQQAEFLVGDSCGTDIKVQKFLHEKKYEKVTVYTDRASAQNNIGGWQVCRISTEVSDSAAERKKDIAMMKVCDEAAVLFFKESNGAEELLEDLERLGKPVSIVVIK